MSEKKRPGTMSDEDRALAALERRRRDAPALGMPIHVPAAEDFTPIGDIYERFELTEREQQLLQIAWIHTANMEMRSRSRADETDCAELAKGFAEHREEFVLFKADLTGASGQNGKLGNLRKDVAEARERADAGPTAIRRAIAIAATSILGALIPAIIYVRNAADSAATARAEAAAERATVRARLDAAEAQLRELLNATIRSARVRASNNNPGDLTP